MRFVILSALSVLATCSSRPVLADAVVTTYVTRVQEERRSTRFTLTEWLRIKERMKLMDVWLAMFSNPKKDEFQPELNLSYFRTRGDLDYTATDVARNDSGSIEGNQAKAQLYLTNIITGSTGLRLFNIDFGLEGGLRQTKDYEPETDEAFANRRKLSRTHWTGNFRLFGKNIQDSSLVFKIGQYQARNTMPQLDGTNDRTMRKGLLVGGELQLYLFRWLGLEANYLDFQGSKDDDKGWSTSGSYYDYLAYIEVSVLRLMFGSYTNDWQFENKGAKAKTRESGYLAGIKLQL